MRYIRLISVILLALGLLLTPPAGSRPALAQGGDNVTGFSDVRLQVYPEYDDPRLLVMVQGKLVGAEPPQRVRFLLPSDADLWATASVNEQGPYSSDTPDREASPIAGWDQISYEVATDTFRVEYYAPISGYPDKVIPYDFRFLYPISDLTVYILEPSSASNFRVTPPGTPFTGDEGFNLSAYQYSNLDPSKPVSFNISYTRTETLPSLSPDQTSSAEQTSGRDDLLTWVVVIVLAAAAGAGLYLVFRRTRHHHHAERRTLTQEERRHGRRRGHGRGQGPRDAAGFCTQCGQPLEESDRFCGNCGAPVS